MTPAWPTKKLGEIAKIFFGGKSGITKKDYIDGGFPAFSAAGQDGFTNEAYDSGCAVILSSIGARCGKCFYASGHWTALANTQVIKIDDCDTARFLFFYLNDERRWPRSGSAQPFISPSAVKNLRVPLPPLTTQRKIVEILDQADALRRKRKEADEKMKQLIPAIFIKIFGDPATNPMGWEVKRLGDVCGLRNGTAFRSSDWSDKGLPIVRIQNLNDETKPFHYFGGDLSNKVVIESGDILLSWSGTPGTSFGCFVWRRGKAVLNQHIFKVIVDKALLRDEYIVVCISLRLDEMISKAHGGVGLSHITKKRLGGIALPAPPLDLQKKFVGLLGDIESQQRAQTKVRQKLDLLFDSLMHRAFRGELLH